MFLDDFLSPISGDLKLIANLGYCKILPVPSQIFHGGKRTRLHPVDVEPPVQVIDLVLQNTREPAGGFQAPRLGLFVEVFDGDAMRALDQRAEARDAQAALKEIDRLLRNTKRSSG